LNSFAISGAKKPYHCRAWDSIQKIMENNNLARKVIIIPVIDQTSSFHKIEKNIHDIFADHEIEVVEFSNIEKYVDRVEAEAH
jgi:peptidase E